MRIYDFICFPKKRRTHVGSNSLCAFDARTSDHNGMKTNGRTRKDCDVHAIRSQQTWGKAHKDGVFDLEIAAVEVKTKKGTQVRRNVL